MEQNIYEWYYQQNDGVGRCKFPYPQKKITEKQAEIVRTKVLKCSERLSQSKPMNAESGGKKP